MKRRVEGKVEAHNDLPGRGRWKRMRKRKRGEEEKGRSRSRPATPFEAVSSWDTGVWL
jgi:hypothetical protein